MGLACGMCVCVGKRGLERRAIDPATEDRSVEKERGEESGPVLGREGFLHRTARASETRLSGRRRVLE